MMNIKQNMFRGRVDFGSIFNVYENVINISDSTDLSYNIAGVL